MKPQMMEFVRNEIKEAVKETVNGTIAELDAKLEAHIQKVEPYLQAAGGAKIIWKIFMGMGSIAITWVAIKSAMGGISIKL